MMEPIGTLHGPPPYRAWELRTDRRPGGPWGIRCASGYNCFGHNGAVFLQSRAHAEAVIRSHGHQPEADK
jgi:hypothetical protein